MNHTTVNPDIVNYLIIDDIDIMFYLFLPLEKDNTTSNNNSTITYEQSKYLCQNKCVIIKENIISDS